MGDTLIGSLSYLLQLGIKPATQARALAWNGADSLSLFRTRPNRVSYTGRTPFTYNLSVSVWAISPVLLPGLQSTAVGIHSDAQTVQLDLKGAIRACRVRVCL